MNAHGYFGWLPSFLVSDIRGFELKHELIFGLFFDFISEASGNVPFDSEVGIHRELLFDNIVKVVCLLKYLFMLL